MTAAVIPVRSFRSGMSRLATVLPPERRFGLGVEMAGRVVSSARQAGLEPLVVSSDPEVAAWSSSVGAALVPDPGDGLDGACRAGADRADEMEVRWVTLHSDLPLITPDDLAPVVRSVLDGRDVIAPSSDGGTSALSARRTIEFAFGPGSFHRHLPLLADPVIVVRRGLLHDLDTADDLASAIRAGAVAG